MDLQLGNIIIMEQELVSVVEDFFEGLSKVSNIPCFCVPLIQVVIWNQNQENVAKDVGLKNVSKLG